MTQAHDDDAGFLARWSKRKIETRHGERDVELVAPTLPAAPIAEPVVAPVSVPPAPQDEYPAPPTLDDVAALTPESDFSRFVGADVDISVRNAALKKLFSDPHYNVMDGLDIYIDDYNKPSPIPPAVLRQMVQARFLGLFGEDATDGSTTPTTATERSPDEDPDLQLQPDDATVGAGTEPGADPHPEDSDQRRS